MAARRPCPEARCRHTRCSSPPARLGRPAGESSAQLRAAWPEGAIARYWTVAGATVDLTHGNRDYPTDDGIGENRNHTLATCTGCPATEEFSHWQVVKRMTFDDKVRDPQPADDKAHEWAQAHASVCRALPRPA